MPKDIEQLRATLARAGIATDGLDLPQMAAVAGQTERVLAGLRARPGFDRAAPAFADWPELAWQPPARRRPS